MTAAWEKIFAALRLAGIAGLLFVLLRVEWSFVHGNFANFFNPLVQLFVIGSMLLVPHFYILLSMIVVGYVGGRIVRRKLAQNASMPQMSTANGTSGES